MQLLQERGVPPHRLGLVGAEALAVNASGETFRWPLGEIHDDWFNTIGTLVRQTSGIAP